MLPGPRLGDNSSLAHPLCEQGLTKCAVDLVRAGVIEIFALQIHIAPDRLREPRSGAQRRRTSDVLLEQPFQFFLKLWIADGSVERDVQLVERGDQRLWYVPPAKCTEAVRRFRCHASAGETRLLLQRTPS